MERGRKNYEGAGEKRSLSIKKTEILEGIGMYAGFNEVDIELLQGITGHFFILKNI